MANKIIIVIVVILIVALVVMLVLSLTAKDEGYYADNITLSSDVNGGKMTQPLVSGNYKLVLEDNRLVLYGPPKDFRPMPNMPIPIPIQVLWSVPSSPGSSLIMQSDGNLVLYDSSNTAGWNSKTSVKGVGSFTLNLTVVGHGIALALRDTKGLRKYVYITPQDIPDPTLRPFDPTTDSTLRPFDPTTDPRYYCSPEPDIWGRNTGGMRCTLRQ